MYGCCASCLATRTLFDKNANNNPTSQWALAPDTNSPAKMNFIDLAVNGAAPRLSSHLLYTFKSTCYHEDVQSRAAVHPEGQVIWYPWSKRWGGLGFAHQRTRQILAVPWSASPSPARDKGRPLFFWATDDFKRNICTDANTPMLWGQRGKLGFKETRWKGARGHGWEVWMALMKDGER